MCVAPLRGWVCVCLAIVLGSWCALAMAGDLQELIVSGNRYWEAGELDQAEASYRRAIEQDPRSVDAHMKLAGLQIARQRYRAGVETFQQAIGLDPDNANAFIGMAIGYLHMGDHQLAYAALEEALRIDPGKRDRVEPLMRQIEARLGDGPHGFTAPPGD